MDTRRIGRVADAARPVGEVDPRDAELMVDTDLGTPLTLGFDIGATGRLADDDLCRSLRRDVAERDVVDARQPADRSLVAFETGLRNRPVTEYCTLRKR